MERGGLAALSEALASFHATSERVALTASLRLCQGASAVLVEDGPGTSASGSACVYVFGGRLVSARVLSNALYRLDLETMAWSRIVPRVSCRAENASVAPVSQEPALPHARYFHSADLWQGKIVICGGMGFPRTPAGDEASLSPRSSMSSVQVVLDEVIAFDLASMSWVLDYACAPKHPVRFVPRYAHLSSVALNHLVILGGQDNDNKYVQDITVFDLLRREWVRTDSLASQCGSYRSIAVSSPFAVYNADGEERMGSAYARPLAQPAWLRSPTELAAARVHTQTYASRPGSSSSLAPDAAGARSASASGVGAVHHSRGQSSSSPRFAFPDSTAALSSLNAVPPGVGRDQNQRPSSSALHPLIDMAASGSAHTAEDAVHLLPTTRRRSPYMPESTSASGSEEVDAVNRTVRTGPILVYSNYNFANVKRELDAYEFVAEADGARIASQVEHFSERMGKDFPLPPGLRFPSGFLCGSHLVVCGTYLANIAQIFSIWALHLPTLSWSRVDSGSILGHGSWNHALLLRRTNSLLVFGDRQRDLVDDYNHRQTNWAHVVSIDLEAAGVYAPPPAGPNLCATAQIGLAVLASATHGASGGSASPAVVPSDAADSPRPERESGSARSGSSTGDAAHPASVPAPNSMTFPYLARTLGGRGDFEIICMDGAQIGVHRAILERRWPWFRDALAAYRAKAKATAIDQSQSQHQHYSLMPAMIPLDEVAPLGHGMRQTDTGTTPDVQALRADVRLTPRTLHLPELGIVAVALVQFLYTGTLCTRVQQHPRMLCSLLLQARLTGLPALTLWAVHGLHIVLATIAPATPAVASSFASSPPPTLALSLDERSDLAARISRAAALTAQHSLQRHALRVSILISRSARGKAND